MPLERQNLELPLSGGLLQNVDERVLPAGRWASVSNLLPVRQGALTKRPGYGLIPRETYPPGDTIAEVVDVIDSRRDELLIYGHRYGASRMWSWSETLERWIDKDDVSPCSVLVQPVASAYVGTLVPRVSVTASGAIAWAWIYTNDASLSRMTTVQRIEEASGAVRQDETEIYAAPGLMLTEQVSVGDEIVTLYADFPGAPLFSRVTDTLTGTISAPIPVISPAIGLQFAACPYDATTYLLAWVDAGAPTDITIWQIDTAGVVVSSFTHVLGGGPVGTIAIDAIAGLGAVVSWWEIGGGVLTMRLADVTWTTVWGPVVDVPIPGVFVVALGTCIDVDDNVTSAATFTSPVVLTNPWRTICTSRDATGTVSFTNESINTVIDHQPFRRDGGAFVTMTQCGPNLQGYGATCLVQVDTADGPSVVATIVRNTGNGGASAFGVALQMALPRAIKTGDTTYILPLSVAAGITQPGTLNVNVASCTFDFNQRQSALRWGAEQRDCLAHSGGLTGWYDGTCEVEVGFVAAPRIASFVRDAVGGSMSDGDYLYAFVWEWRDERGNIHTSAPETISVGLTGGTATQKVTFDIDTLALTRKGDVQDGTAKEVTVQVYRTVNNGTLFIRETMPKGGANNAVVNDKSLATVPYLDTLNDGQLQALGYGFLYTTGDVLENQMAPAARAIVSTKNRLWLASAENPRELWFSKLIVNGEGPGFNGSLVLTLDDANDEITALAALDDKVVVFTRKRIYYVSGDGPNDTGGGGGFQGPLRLPSDVGCSDQRSVVTYPEGVVYWDGDQIARLTRGLTMEPFGDPVLDVTERSYGVIGKLDPAAQRIHFLVYRDLPARADKNIFAVHDYRFGQWATHTQYGTNGDFDGPALVVAHHWHNGQHWLSHGDGEESTLGRTRFDLFSGYDTDVWFPATLETPWIHVAGVNGYQRAWDVTFTGKQLTQHRLIVEVFTDYDLTTIRQRMVCDVQAGSPMLGLPVERLSLLLRSQLCSAVKFRIYDEAPDDPIVAQDPTGWDIAGLTIGLGIKPGGARLPARNRG